MVPGLWLLLQKLLTTGIKMLGQRADKRLADLENKDYVDTILAEFWLWEYVRYTGDNRQDVRAKNAFRNRLSSLVHMISLFHHHMRSFLPGPSFRPQGFLFQLKRRYRYCSWQGLAEKCEIPLMVYKLAFIYFDQYTAIIENTIRNVIVTSTAMSLVFWVLIPPPLCSLWVTLPSLL